MAVEFGRLPKSDVLDRAAVTLAWKNFKTWQMAAAATESVTHISLRGNNQYGIWMSWMASE